MEIEGLEAGVFVVVGEGSGNSSAVDEGAVLVAVAVLMGGVVLGLVVGRSGCVESCVPTAEGVAEDTRPTRWQAASKVPTAPRASPTNRRRDTTIVTRLPAPSPGDCSGFCFRTASGQRSFGFIGTTHTNLSSRVPRAAPTPGQ